MEGRRRKSPLKVEELTIEDLENVIRDVRTNADRVYKGIFDEFSYVTDTLRSTQDDWVSEARESIYKQQEMVVEYLEEKVNKAPEKASDEFMYQDRGEAQHELEVARKIFDDIPAALREKDLEYRIWNPLPYKRYRGSDEE